MLGEEEEDMESKSKNDSTSITTGESTGDRCEGRWREAKGQRDGETPGAISTFTDQRGEGETRARGRDVYDCGG